MAKFPFQASGRVLLHIRKHPRDPAIRENGVRSKLTAALLVFVGLSVPATAEEDLQFWFPTQIIHPLTDDLSVSMQAEIRLKDDISDFGELVLKPALNYHIDEQWGFSFGYKYIDKGGKPNEQDPWQEFIYSTAYKDLMVKQQVRLEQRLIDGIDGMIPRVRLLTHLAHQIGDSPYYLSGFGAVRFNMNDKGQGPVSGFEQLRLYAAVGRHLNEHVQVELGYLWRYERERSGTSSLSDHAIHLQMVIHTDKKKGLKPAPRDVYR